MWVGAGALGRRSGRVALYFREDAALLGAPPAPPAPEGGVHDALRARLAQGACFFTDLLTDVPGMPTEELVEALWDLVWAGEVTNDAWAPLRSPKLTAAAPWSQKARAERRRSFSARRRGAQPTVQGRWSLTESLFRRDDPAARRRAQAELLLERYGIVTREQVLAEGIPGGFSSLYDSLAALETIGVARRGYFIEGLGGAQFALPGAVERLRSQRDDDAAPPLVLAATDPAQPYGAALKWPKTENRSPARTAGAYVVLAGAEPVLYVERGGKGLQFLVAEDDERLAPSLEALVDAVRRGRVTRLAIERVNGEPVVGSPYESGAARARLPRRAAQADAQRLKVELGGRQRPRDVEALRDVAAQRRASACMISAVSTPSATTRRPRLRARSIVERTITASFSSSAMPGHERAVDLDLVERQPLEVGERGVAGAEVVERQAARRARAGPSSTSVARTGSAITVCSEISHSSRSPGTPWRPSSAGDRGRAA